MSKNLTRRNFIKNSSLAASTLAFPSIIRAQGQNEKLQVGFVAVGGRAGAHTGAAHRLGLQCIAFAEVDKSRWDGVLGKEGWKEAKGYTDWREMFNKHGKELDVVFVATPDHSPLRPLDDRGLHGHPLLHREAAHLVGARGADAHRRLQEEPQGRHPDGQPGARRQGWRLAYEFIKGGAIGDVHGIPHLDQPPDLAAGRRPPRGRRSDPGEPRLGCLDRRCADAPVQRRTPTTLQMARRRRLRLRRARRHGLPHHRRHLRDHGPRLRRLRRADLHDRPGRRPVPRRHDHQGDLPRQRQDRPGFTTFWYEGKRADGSDNMPETPRN